MKLPALHDVRNAWYEYVEQHLKDIRETLSKRPHIQRKLLEAIAIGIDHSLSSQKNQIEMQLSSSAIVQALKVLEDQDYIEKVPEKRYRIIDLAIMYALRLARQE